MQMLVQCRAIKSAQRKRILGKMRRHPVHDYADVVLMQVVDQVAQIIRCSIASGWRVVVADLVTPRWTIRMFLKWQKLNMRKTHLGNILGEWFCEFAITERAIVLLEHPSPRAEMKFINRYWSFVMLLPCS